MNVKTRIGARWKGLLQLSSRESLVLGFGYREGKARYEITMSFVAGEWSQDQNKCGRPVWYHVSVANCAVREGENCLKQYKPR